MTKKFTMNHFSLNI